MLLTQKQGKKLWMDRNINIRYILNKEYVDSIENKWVKNKFWNFSISLLFITWLINLIIVWMIALVPEVWASEEKHILDKKIEKFCKQYWEEKSLTWYINKCIKHWQAMMRYETWWICKDKNNKNCFNFKSISKANQKWFNIKWLDKSWFTIFWDKTNSIKYFAYRFYKYDYRKTTRQIISWWCMKNLQGKKVCFSWFTHTAEHWENYISFIENFKL